MESPGKQVTNRDVTERLAFMSRLLEVAGSDRYRIGAYERAARQVERLPLPVAGLDEEELTRVPGIGVKIAGQIREIAATGSFRELNDLQTAVPGSLVELLDVAGVGPRTLRVLWKRLGVRTVEDLAQAVEGHRIRALPGFGVKKEEMIKRGIRQLRRKSDRMTRQQAEAVLASARALLPRGGYAVAGSYRRGSSTVGRIEIVAIGDRSTFLHRPGTAADDAELNIRFTDPERCGTALLCATGSRGFLDRLGAVAQKQGYRLD